MNNCIIQLEVDHCPESGCSGPSVTNVVCLKIKHMLEDLCVMIKILEKYLRLLTLKKVYYL